MGPNDDTVVVLEAFLNHLSKEGQMTLMRELVLFPDMLRQLRDFLVSAVLKPSMYIVELLTYKFSVR